MSLTEPCAFIFDMDGVLCDNNAYHRASWLEYAQRLGKDLSDTDIENKVYGKTNAEILAYVFGRELEAEELMRHAEAKEALFRDMYRGDFCLTTGLEDFLKAAKAKGIKLGLATNAPESNLAFVLEMGKLGSYFSAQAHAAQVTNPKPAPDIYLYVAEALGVDPHRCVVFEDSLTGMAAARAAGCEVVGIASTLPFDRLQQMAVRVAKDFASLSVDECTGLLDKGSHARG